jgi:hypothetical protein
VPDRRVDENGKAVRDAATAGWIRALFQLGCGSA